MTVRIRPSIPEGTVAAPPSKSMAHRLLICAGLAEGESVVRGLALSQDVLATLDCLRALGAGYVLEPRDDGLVDCRIQGADLSAAAFEEVSFPCRESGSTLRFFTPLGLALGGPVTLTGTAKLLSRPLGAYQEICRQQNLFFSARETELLVQGPLSPGEFTLPGDVSSQFVSGLLFTCPLLPGPSTIHLTPPVESRPYIDMTLDALAAFDVFAVWKDDTTLLVPGHQACLPTDIRVEGDWSNAAFLMALGEKVQVSGLNEQSLQGDAVCRDIFAQLAAGPAQVDLSDCPDLGPVAMVVAAMNHGATFIGTRRLAVKESDRGRAMQQELAKFGVTVEVEENGITVVPPAGGLHAPAEPLDGHNDHRIVMACAVLCTRTGGEIRGESAVAKSFPDFFAQLRGLGVRMDFAAEGPQD